MKKIVIVLLMFLPFIVNASGGTLVQKSVKICSDGQIYGYHTQNGEKHYHIAVKNENGTYIASSKESLGIINPCADPIKTEKQDVILNDCIDGDTAEFLLNESIIKVRFLAVDTPESVHPTKGEEPYGKEASNYTCEKLKNANTIVLEFDPNSDKTDKYDRYLAWIYVDNVLLQKELISKGYAKIAYLYGDYLYTDELQKEEEIAKANKIGIWGDYEKNYMIEIITVIILLIVSILWKKIKKIIKKIH